MSDAEILLLLDLRWKLRLPPPHLRLRRAGSVHVVAD
jgi:hypothetical protein